MKRAAPAAGVELGLRLPSLLQRKIAGYRDIGVDARLELLDTCKIGAREFHR